MNFRGNLKKFRGRTIFLTKNGSLKNQTKIGLFYTAGQILDDIHLGSLPFQKGKERGKNKSRKVGETTLSYVCLVTLIIKTKTKKEENKIKMGYGYINVSMLEFATIKRTKINPFVSKHLTT